MASDETMSEARLAEIRRWQVGYHDRFRTGWDGPAIDAVGELLAEVERLREIVQVIADSQLQIEPDGRGSLLLPPGQINHQVREKARAMRSGMLLPMTAGAGPSPTEETQP